MSEVSNNNTHLLVNGLFVRDLCECMGPNLHDVAGITANEVSIGADLARYHTQKAGFTVKNRQITENIAEKRPKRPNF